MRARVRGNAALRCDAMRARLKTGPLPWLRSLADTAADHPWILEKS